MVIHFFLYLGKFLSDFKGTLSKAQLLYLPLQFTILNKNSLMPSRNSFRLKPQSGFALVIALGLMSFIVLLLLGITTFVRVESSAAAQSLRILEARQNAMLGMQIALGELQAAAGPDQRVTAKADLFNNTHETRRHLTGVWNTTTGNFQQWLVSDFNRHGSSADTQAFAQSAAPNPANDDTVVLLGPGSLDSSGGVLANAADAVVVGMANTGINATNRLVGRYAWWIDDEGVKARINLDNPFFGEGKQPSVLALNSFNRGEVGFLTDFSGFNLEQDEVSRVSSIRDLSLSGVTENNVRRRFFDFTTWSAGVLADVVDGRLKRDLSLAFELPDGDFNNSVFANAGPNTAYRDTPDFPPGLTFDVQPIFYCSNGGRGPTWHLLRDYYTIYQRIKNPMTDPVFTAQSIGPNRSDSGPLAVKNPTDGGWWDETLLTFRFASHFATYYAGDDLRADSLRSIRLLQNNQDGNQRIDIPVPIRAHYAPYINRHFIAYHVFFDDVTSLIQGASNWGDVENTSIFQDFDTFHRPRLRMRPVFVLHNPFNVKIEHEGFFSYLSQQSFIAEIGNTLGDKNWYFSASGRRLLDDRDFSVAGIGSRGMSHILRVDPDVSFSPGELKIFAAIQRDDTGFSPEGVPDNFITHETGGIAEASFLVPDNVAAYPIIPVNTADETPNFSISFRPNAPTIGWVYNVFHFMGRPGVPITAANTNALSGNYAINHDNIGGFRSHRGAAAGIRVRGLFPDHFEPWYSPEFPREPAEPFYSGTYLIEEGEPGLSNPFFNFDLYWKPTDNRHRYPNFIHTNPLAPSISNRNLFSIDNANPFNTDNIKGFPSLSPGLQLDIYSASAGMDTVRSIGNNALWGASNETGLIRQVASIELPTTPPVSLGKLQNANLSIHGHMPALAVGNSFASPYLRRDRTTNLFVLRPGQLRVFYDLSYLANQALWDRYFFSSYSLPYDSDADEYLDDLGAGGSFDAAFDPSFQEDNVLTGTLPNSRMQLFAPRETLDDVRRKLFRAPNFDIPSLTGYDRAAENLLVAGSFNINSTSVDAWRSVLSAARNLPVYRSGQSGSESYGSDLTPLTRLTQPTQGRLTGNASSQEAWGGFSALTDQQIDRLATEIVAELKRRVNSGAQNRPFTGLAEFVNRRLSTDDFGLAGLLQAAIDRSGINSGFTGDAVSLNVGMANFPHSGNIQSGDGSSRSAASGASAKILQGTILQAIGSFISPRSDTFRIRSYGEVISATPGGRNVKAWAEAVYQRVPEPVVPSADKPDDINFWVPEEINRFGRRFVLVSFRWLTEDEV